jgi:hypothetical protein
LTRIAIQAARKVHRQNPLRHFIENLDNPVQRGARIAASACPEKSVNDPIRSVELFRDPFGVNVPGCCHNRHSRPLQYAKIIRSFALEFVVLPPEQNTDVMTAQIQMACDHESVSSIIAMAATDSDGPADVLLAKDICATASGILHQYGSQQPILLDSRLVESARLSSAKIAGRGIHRSELPFWSRQGGQITASHQISCRSMTLRHQLVSPRHFAE